MKTPRVAAMDYLARREHTRVELQRKLQQKGYDFAEITEALDRLCEQGLQSDRRFAVAFAEQRARNGHGPFKIKQELQQHGVEDSLAESVMAHLEVDWQTAAMAVWRKKFNRVPQDLSERAKQHRFMCQRGFIEFEIPS